MRQLSFVIAVFAAGAATTAHAAHPWVHWSKYAACGGGICLGQNSSAEGFMDYTRLPNGAGTKNDRDHRSARSLVYRPLNVNANGHTLLVFLHGGDGGSAEHYTKFYEWAATQGYYVIGLDWMNDASPTSLCTCNGSAADDCYAKWGEQLTSTTSVDNGFFNIFFGPGKPWSGHRGYNSVERRLGLLLQKMADNPYPVGDAQFASRWKSFIAKGSDPVRPDWSKIVIAGHSDGSQLAMYILKSRPVIKGLFFSGPKTRLSRPVEKQANVKDGNDDYTSASKNCTARGVVPHFLTDFAKSKQIRAFTSYWDDRYEPHVTDASDPVPADPDAAYENGWQRWDGGSQSRLLAGRGKVETRVKDKAPKVGTVDPDAKPFDCPPPSAWTDWITTTRKLSEDKDHGGTVADGGAGYYQPGFRECVWSRMLNH